MGEKPMADGWFALGEGKGIRWVLWSNSVALERKEKENDSWKVTEEVHLAPKVLKEIFWRLPGWIDSIEKSSGGNE